MGSDNGLLPLRRQAIIWTNAGILSVVPLETNVGKKINRDSNIFFEYNAYEIVVCKTASILSRR